MTRIMAIQAIKNDPDWKNGEYASQPRGLIAARNIRSIMTGSALQYQKENPTAEKADAALEEMAKAALRGDANDTIYQYEASTDYNPSPMLEKIQAPLFAINSADDEINPPELCILDREIKKVKRGRFRAAACPISLKLRKTIAAPRDSLTRPGRRLNEVWP